MRPTHPKKNRKATAGPRSQPVRVCVRVCVHVHLTTFPCPLAKAQLIQCVTLACRPCPFVKAFMPRYHCLSALPLRQGTAHPCVSPRDETPWTKETLEVQTLSCVTFRSCMWSGVVHHQQEEFPALQKESTEVLVSSHWHPPPRSGSRLMRNLRQRQTAMQASVRHRPSPQRLTNWNCARPRRNCHHLFRCSACTVAYLSSVF